MKNHVDGQKGQKASLQIKLRKAALPLLKVLLKIKILVSLSKVIKLCFTLDMKNKKGHSSKVRKWMFPTPYNRDPI